MIQASLEESKGEKDMKIVEESETSFEEHLEISLHAIAGLLLTNFPTWIPKTN